MTVIAIGIFGQITLGPINLCPLNDYFASPHMT